LVPAEIGVAFLGGEWFVLLVATIRYTPVGCFFLRLVGSGRFHHMDIEVL
jgi:hypothetical protein